MSTRIHLGLFAVTAALLAAACGDDPGSLTGRGGSSTDPTNPNGTDPTAAELQCTQKPQGKSYTLFDGSKLEDSRVNENVGVNRARIKPYGVLAGEFQRVIGTTPASLAGAAGSFDSPPDRWYAEASHSGVSLNAFFGIAFEGCAEYVKAQPDLAQPPTTETASAQCGKLMRKAWSRTATPEEISGCATLATDKLKTEANTQRRWAYVCASVLSSSQFLTF